MALYYDEIFEDAVRFGLRVNNTIFDGRSEYQRVEVIDTVRFGRMLVIDGVFMTSERDEFFYHEMLTQPALTTVDRLRRVLVIGGGDGGSVREVLRHTCVEQCVMVEIDELVVRVSRQYLPMIGTAWDDPRLDLRIGDAIAYVKESSDEPYDVIIVDGTDPVGPGEGLFNEAFYRGCKRMLAPHGVLALQSESPIYFRPVFSDIQRVLGSIFTHVHPYFGPVPVYSSGVWSWTYCTDAADPLNPNVERQAPIAASSRYYNEQVHQGAFALPNYLKDVATAPGGDASTSGVTSLSGVKGTGAR